MAATKKSRKPIQTVTEGNVRIPIYKGCVTGENGREYDAFTVAAYVDGKRRRWMFGAVMHAEFSQLSKMT